MFYNFHDFSFYIFSYFSICCGPHILTSFQTVNGYIVPIYEVRSDTVGAWVGNDVGAAVGAEVGAAVSGMRFAFRKEARVPE